MNFGGSLGSTWLGDGRCLFRVWAPQCAKVDLHLVAPIERWVPLTRVERGYHEVLAESVDPGAQYYFQLDEDQEYPDPTSRYQPDGVSGPSEVIYPSYPWEDRAWSGLAQRDYIFYELHVGAFTDEGSFEALIPHLRELRDLGITALELMPVAQFSGGRNWGYDGVYPFAAQNTYGGPAGLKRLVNAAHQQGLAVVLDVVYNHLGPEGNYLQKYGPYFTSCYHTPWGESLNFDQPHSDEVRHFFIENALYWVRDCHIDALRLDAIHAIKDFSAHTFLEELTETVHAEAERLGRRIHLFAESDLNNARVIRSRDLGGFGLDAQWNDDFHHALHVTLTGEQDGYYQDFDGVSALKRAIESGYVYTGQFSPSRQCRHGNASRNIPARRFIVFSQNHDQIGNRMLGERLAGLAPFEKLKLAAGAVLLTPGLPLLFMGEEYGDPAPFLYFTSHSGPELVEAIRRGRREEFNQFAWRDEVPDPHDEQTFAQSRPNRHLRTEGRHRALYKLYRELLRLRKALPALAGLDRDKLEVSADPLRQTLALRRWQDGNQVLGVFNFSSQEHTLRLSVPPGRWHRLLDSEDPQWAGGGSLPCTVENTRDVIECPLKPHAFSLFSKGDE